MSKVRIILDLDVTPKPKRSREDNLKILAECKRLREELRRLGAQLPDGI